MIYAPHTAMPAKPHLLFISQHKNETQCNEIKATMPSKHHAMMRIGRQKAKLLTFLSLALNGYKCSGHFTHRGIRAFRGIMIKGNILFLLGFETW
jgi:hypothetical protein